jgi:hypothetical protein
MSEPALFLFGLLVTLFALGPLTIAAILELRGEDRQN